MGRESCRLRLSPLARQKPKAKTWDGLVPEAEGPLRALAGAGWRSLDKNCRDGMERQTEWRCLLGGEERLRHRSGKREVLIRRELDRWRSGLAVVVVWTGGLDIGVYGRACTASAEAEQSNEE